MIDLLLALFSGVVGGLLLAVLPKATGTLRQMVALVFCALGAFFTWRVALAVFAGEGPRLAANIGGFTFSLHPDPLGALFALLVSTLWVFALLYSFGYLATGRHERTYYVYFLLAFSVTLGVAFAGNLLALYLCYELLTFVTYPLVIHERNNAAVKAGTKYIIYHLSGAGAILLGIVILHFWVGGPLEFAKEALLAGADLRPGLDWLLALFVIGFGVKAAVMPLHRWLPAAMVAPTPVSALLQAVAVVNCGVYGILRTIYSIFGPALMSQLRLSVLLPWLAAFTIVGGSLVALRQDVLKRRLAYSTISQLSYVLLGAFTLHPWGLAGAVFHMLNHSLLKIVLFFGAGIMAKESGKVRVSGLAGVGWQLPRTLVAFGVGSLGMIGMLPLNAFWSKYYLVKGSVAGGMWPMAVVLGVSGLLNAFYFVPILMRAFQGKPSQGVGRPAGRGRLMLVPTLILVGMVLMIGLWPGLVWRGVESVVDWFFSGGGL